MPAQLKNRISLLIIFYKSTLLLSISFSVMAGGIFVISDPAASLTIFAATFMTGGTVLSLFYKELALKHEYYFYYNQAISKNTLMATCAVTNVVIGASLMLIA